MACCGVLNVLSNQRQSAALSIGCPGAVPPLLREGILLVGGARGLHLLDRSSNRRASWETPTPGRETKCTFDLRTKKCVFVEEKEQMVKCQVLSSDSGIIISIQHIGIYQQYSWLCQNKSDNLALRGHPVRRSRTQKNGAASNPLLIKAVGGNKLPLQLLTEAGEMFHFYAILLFLAA